MATATDHVLQLHADIKGELDKLVAARPQAAPPAGTPAVKAGIALPGFATAGLLALAESFVPVLTEAAITLVKVPVEQFAVGHKDFVRRFVSEKSLEFADKLLKDLEDVPVPQ
jgi:hypothetical protein